MEESDSKTIKPKARNKPLVEGINTPKKKKSVVSPVVTQEEKAFALEPENQDSRLLPDSVIDRINKPKGKHKGWVEFIVMLLVLALGGYLLYQWQANRNEPSKLADSQDEQSQQIIEPSMVGGTSTAPSQTTTSTPSSTPETILPTPPVVKKLKVATTPNGFLNVRSTPSTSGTILTKVHPGEIYVYTDKQSGWYKIVVSATVTGWVSSDYVTLQ